MVYVFTFHLTFKFFNNSLFLFYKTFFADFLIILAILQKPGF